MDSSVKRDTPDSFAVYCVRIISTQASVLSVCAQCTRLFQTRAVHLFRTEMSMSRWMCEVKLNERNKSEELGRTLKIGTS